MLKARHILGLALLFALVGDSLATSRSQHSRNESNKTEQRPAAEQRGTQDQPFTVNVVPTAEQKAETEKKDGEARRRAANESKLVDYAFDQVIVAVVTFFIFLLQLAAFSLQARYMHRTVIEMRRTTHATIRAARAAQTAADTAKKSADSLATIERAYIFVNTVPTKVSYHFVNHGKTPAIIGGIERRFDPLTSPPDNTNFLANVLDANEVGIAAGERYPREGQNAPLCESIQTANIGDAPAGFLWFYGTIVYSDVFWQPRLTRFRWRYNRVTQEFRPFGAPHIMSAHKLAQRITPACRRHLKHERALMSSAG